MHINSHYKLVRRAIARLIGNQGPYKPGPDEPLEANYGMVITARRDLALRLNEVYSEEGNPIHPILTPPETGDKDTVRKLVGLVAPRFSVFVAAVFLFSQVSAALPAAIEDFDHDGRPQSVSGSERRAYFASRLKLPMERFDANKNGRIDPDELDAVNAFISKAVDEEVAAYFSDDAGSPGADDKSLPLETVLGVLKEKPKSSPPPGAEQPPPDDRYATDWALHLRQSVAEISVRAKALDSRAASFSLAHDATTMQTTGRINAALGVLGSHVIRSGRNPQDGRGYLSEVAWGASVGVDRTFDPRGSAFERDKLHARIGGDIEITSAGFDLQYLSLWGTLDTNSRFERPVFGLDAVYEPFSRHFIQAYPVGNGRITAQFIPTLEAHYRQGAPGTFADPAVSRYLNVGFGAGIELAYRNDRGKIVGLGSKYEHYWDALGGIAPTWRWNTQLEIPITANEHASVTMDYVREFEGATGSSTNTLRAGLGMRF